MTVLPLLQGLVLRSRASLRTLQCWTCASNASGLHWAEAVFAQGGFHAHNRGRSNLVSCSFAFQWGARRWHVVRTIWRRRPGRRNELRLLFVRAMPGSALGQRRVLLPKSIF